MSVDGHPATLARNIAVSLDTEIDEPAAARGRALRAVLATGGATPAAWGRELVSGPAPAPQTLGQGWIDVVYFRQDEGNILEPAALAEAHRLELALRDDPAFTRLCQKATEDEIQALDASMCRLPDSAMNFFFPTVRGEGTEEETLITNGRGAARAVQDTAKALLLSKQEGYFDRFASASDATVKSVLLGSRHFFGGPLPGYSSTGDRRAEQQAKYQAFTSTLLRMSRETQTSAVRFVFVGDGATVMTQIFEELAASVIYAVAAVGFILGYVWLQTGSLWLACASAAQILLTFPVTYLLYTTVMGYERIGIMNLMSLWAIAGIGVDDVFLLTEMFKHSRKESRASETMPDESSRLLADVADNRVRRATRQAHDRHAALTSALAEGSAAMLVTSLTTAASFYANAISRIPAVRGFGLWTGTLVVANYVLVLTFFASALSFYEANFRLCLPRWAASGPPPSRAAARDRRMRTGYGTDTMATAADSVGTDWATSRPAPTDSAGRPAFKAGSHGWEASRAGWHSPTCQGCFRAIFALRFVIATLFVALLAAGGYYASQIQPAQNPPLLLVADTNLETIRRLLSDYIVDCTSCRLESSGSSGGAWEMPADNSGPGDGEGCSVFGCDAGEARVPGSGGSIPVAALTPTPSTSSLPPTASPAASVSPSSLPSVSASPSTSPSQRAAAASPSVSPAALLPPGAIASAPRPVALSPQLVRNDWYPPSAAGAGVADYNLQSRALDDYTAAALLTAASEPITPVSLAQAKAWARINTSPAPYPFLQHELSLPQQLPGGRFKFRVRAEGPGGPGPFSPESAELVMPGNIGPPGISPSPSASPAPSDAPDSGGGGDPFSPRVEPCYGLFGGQDCSTKAADPYPLSAGSYSMVALILGVAGSKPNPSFVPSESAGSSLISSAGTAEVAVKADAVRETSPILDPAFDLADPAAQAYMIRLCEWIEEQPDLVLYKDPPDCWMRRFRDWLGSASGPAGVAFPVTNRTRFPELLVTWARQHGGRNFFGVSTVSNQVVWARMLLRSTIDWQSAGFVISQQEFPKWQAVVEHVKATAPSTLGSNPVQASDVWLRAFVEEEFVTGTALACAISVGAAFLTTLCFVQSIALAMFTAVAVGAILVTLLAFIVLSGSSLGVIEAIAVVCLVGLSIDAALHFAHGYIHAPVWLVEAADERAGLEPGEEPGSRLPDWAEAVARLGPRGARASFAMQRMGWPIVSSAITTAGASAFLLLTTIEILRVFGVILVFTLACSLVITIVGLSALLSVAGPRSTLCEACARGCRCVQRVPA
ncbi:hypothetical protein FNF29_05510 [Cafeteria roenbergensis]|uniref:SSD domain-containing protein n=1 Tax=Cafeteria roenbergensis TaxID=33653 RepID=A0A5A8CDC9_CAFRO|nr:hypothetical protein FNF29_05510 [Cafeteria roenbergensis]|eukprot:KAA0150070.1 hypothetical protein FNF29_05510 [Cafeteria roenbergensis]